MLFTAHSLPERVRDMGDTYPEQLQESAALVAAAAGLDALAGGLAERRAHPRALARSRRARRGPPAGCGRRDGREGAVDGVVVCPIGFVTDHLEVLYDLDVELAAVADEVGLPFARTASLNDDPRFIGVLADVIGAAEARRD